jgi:hypothetical protein
LQLDERGREALVSGRWRFYDQDMATDSALIVVDGDLSDEKLSDLIARRTEYPELDYKSRIDLQAKDRRDLIELTKDIGAMQVRGGYILLGIDDDGSLSGAMDEVELRPFDEASLTAKVEKYLTGPLGLATRVTSRESHVIVAIYVNPHPLGCSFFKVDGAYENRDRKTITAFRAYDAYCRIGTKSVRLTQQGFEEVVSRRLAAAKHEWMEEQSRIRNAEIAGLQVASRSSDLANAPLGSVNLDMRPSELSLTCLEFIRKGDRVGLQHLFKDALRRGRLFVHNEDLAGLDDLLDSLACLAANFLSYDEPSWFDKVIDVFVRLYDLPFEHADSKRFGYASALDPEEVAPRLWLAILERVFALGALAVREERWDAARALMIQLPPGLVQGGYEANWLRHGITMASRASHLRKEGDGRTKELSLLSLAKGVIERLECLRPDLQSEDSDPMFTSLARFDFLFNVVAIGEAKTTAGKVFYPSFARLRQERIQPVADRLLHSPEFRQVIFPLDDEDLAIALIAIGERATHEGWAYDGFDGWGHTSVGDFIAEHSPDEP